MKARRKLEKRLRAVTPPIVYPPNSKRLGRAAIVSLTAFFFLPTCRFEVGAKLRI